MQSLPPRVPETLSELDLAVMMLGHVARGAKLKRPARGKLAQLLGAYPRDVRQAAEWKRLLKALRPDILELDAR